MTYTKAYQQSVGQCLAPNLKKMCHELAKQLLCWHGTNNQNILFTHENTFTVEEKYNKQNDKLYARSSQDVKKKVPTVYKGTTLLQ